MSRDAYVLLEDGTRFDGLACGADTHAAGEIVFTTSMSGYQEAMTDPSYAGQLIAFTFPQVGNYGVSESARSCAPPSTTATRRTPSRAGSAG
jgi:carbamoyl-phosphate synthase small subunit